MSEIKRSVFYVSDHTGLTSEAVGRSLVSQFPQVEWNEQTLPYVIDDSSLQKAQEQIQEAFETDGMRPVVVSTIINTEMSKKLASTNALVVEVMGDLLSILEQDLGMEASGAVGKVHSTSNFANYERRIQAVQFSLDYDDGSNVEDLEGADVVLLGVSRSGKTPTCLYLAIQYGIKAGNVPLTPTELEDLTLPQPLLEMRNKLFGLDLQASRLTAIRQERLPGTSYASPENCTKEVEDVRELFRRHSVPHIDATWLSVEEIAVRVMEELNLSRQA